MIREAIARVIERKDLNEKQMVEVMNEIMSGETTPAQIGSFITALRMKGETVEEISGAAMVMREKATRIETGVAVDQGEILVDTCGTGGDSSGTFNVSTTTAFVVAAAGIPVAKHGNRSVSSKCGSADVLPEEHRVRGSRQSLWCGPPRDHPASHHPQPDWCCDCLRDADHTAGDPGRIFSQLPRPGCAGTHEFLGGTGQ